MVRLHRDILLLFLLGAATTLTVDPVVPLTPEIVNTSLGSSDALVGVLIGAFSVGGMLGGLFFVTVEPTRMVTIFRAALVVDIGMIVFVTAHQVWLAIAALVVAGGAFVLTSTMALAGLQRRMASSGRGRLAAMSMTVTIGVRPLAGLVDGSLAAVATPLVAALAMSSLQLPVVGRGLTRSRASRWPADRALVSETNGGVDSKRLVRASTD
jgi:hypothetical protein